MSPGRAQSASTWTYALVSALFMMIGAAMAAWSLYAVFESTRFVTVAATAILAGAAIAVVSERLGWSGLVAAGVGAIAYLAIGVSLAVPGVMQGEVPVTTALGELVRGPVTGWKDIVTLPLPLGVYAGTLVPPLALLLGGTLASTWLAIHARRRWGLAAGVTVAMVAVAVVVGPALRAEPLSWAPYGVYANREFVVGLVTFGSLLGWLAWRSVYLRGRARKGGSDGARLAAPPRLRAINSAAAASVMGVVAVVTAAIIAGPVAAETPRDVARSVIDPRVVVDTTVTPLAAYRDYFADEAFGEVLFSVEVTDGTADRVRLATLPYFTGDSFTASAPEGSPPARFERVPSRIAGAFGATPFVAQVRVDGHSGVWVPLVGELGSVEFTSERAGELVDSLFYQPATRTGLVTNLGGLASGDAYTIRGFTTSRVPALDAIGAAPDGDVIDSRDIPPALVDWVARQGVSRDGAGLADLVQRLRERGYLSHSLLAAETTPRWQSALGEYAFAPSAAGHSFDRVDRMFEELTARESETVDTPGASLVAAVGDDEQFAAAVALMAAELGFPSRVVLGAHLVDTDPAGWTVPACVDGQCKGQNMAVWAEVQAANGAWIPIDVTPQHSSPPAPDIAQLQDPQFASDLDPARAEPMQPPSAQRGGVAEEAPTSAPGEQAWGWLGVALGVASVTLLTILVFVLPLLAILVWKALRRRRRRRSAPRDAIHHGWDEYVDNAVDAGLSPLPLATRLEAARAYASPNGEALARLTDAATFGTDTAVEDDAEAFWQLVAADREAWLASRGRWARMRMRFSLRSVLHAVAMQAPDSAPGSQSHIVDPHAWSTGQGGAR